MFPSTLINAAEIKQMHTMKLNCTMYLINLTQLRCFFYNKKQKVIFFYTKVLKSINYFINHDKTKDYGQNRFYSFVRERFRYTRDLVLLVEQRPKQQC